MLHETVIRDEQKEFCVREKKMRVAEEQFFFKSILQSFTFYFNYLSNSIYHEQSNNSSLIRQSKANKSSMKTRFKLTIYSLKRKSFFLWISLLTCSNPHSTYCNASNLIDLLSAPALIIKWVHFQYQINLKVHFKIFLFLLTRKFLQMEKWWNPVDKK